MTGFPVAVPAVLETAVARFGDPRGGRRSATHPDLPAAIAAMTSIAGRIEPRAEHAAVYDRLFEAYVALYPATAPVLRPLTEDAA